MQVYGIYTIYILNKGTGPGGVTRVVEHLSSKCKALSSNTAPQNKQKRNSQWLGLEESSKESKEGRPVKKTIAR
jgi:hypothetical protein